MRQFGTEGKLKAFLEMFKRHGDALRDALPILSFARNDAGPPPLHSPACHCRSGELVPVGAVKEFKRHFFDVRRTERACIITPPQTVSRLERKCEAERRRALDDVDERHAALKDTLYRIDGLSAAAEL